MEENKDGKQKPLRPSGNKVKDLYNAYFRNEGSRTIPINGPDDKKETNLEDILENNNEVLTSGNVLESVDDHTIEFLREIDDLNNKISALEKERNEAKEQSVRKSAELDNVIKRTTREKFDMIDYANEKLLTKLLPIADDLGNAVIAGQQNSDTATLLKGVEMIYQKMLRLLDEEGIKPIDTPAGKPFDVNFHEAMLQMPSEYTEGSVIQEIQKGYMLREKVLRHTKVITSSGKPVED